MSISSGTRTTIARSRRPRKPERDCATKRPWRTDGTVQRGAQAERIAERASQFLEFDHLFRVGFFVRPVQRAEAAPIQIPRHLLVGQQHELLDQPVGDVPLAAGDGHHVAQLVELEHRFGQIEIDRPAFLPPRVEQQRQFLHQPETIGQRGILRGCFGIAFQHFIHVRVSHPLGRPDHARSESRHGHAAAGLDIHDDAHHQAVFARIQRADSIRKFVRKHRYGAIGKVDRCAAQARFPIERRAARNIVRDVGDVHLKPVAAARQTLDVNRVVEIPRRFAVDRHDGEIPEILPARQGVGLNRSRRRSRLGHHVVGKNVRQAVLSDDDFDIDARLARLAQNLDYAPGGAHPAPGESGEFDVHRRAVKILPANRGFRPRLPELGRYFLAGGHDDFLRDPRIEGSHHAAARRVMKDSDQRWVRAPDDSHHAPFGPAVGAAALDSRQHAVAMHRIANVVGPNVQIAFESERRIRRNEAVAVPVHNDSACEEIGVAPRRGARRASPSWLRMAASGGGRRRAFSRGVRERAEGAMAMLAQLGDFPVAFQFRQSGS
jgi:hypothetical protein